LKDWLLDHLPESFVTAFLGALGWWVQRKVAHADALEKRVAALESDQVTSGDISALREHIDRSISGSLARVEQRTDEILLYLARRDGR
jgi:hypothetical protein